MGIKLHGATVHFVNFELDHGPIVAQAAVPVLVDDTEDTRGARVLAQEHVIYPRAIRAFIEGRVRIENGKALVAEKSSATS
jgi:phosphoribosylglycinamide formyltransferase-1